ncbi:toxin-antitoxin system YwqK family antitoxin [Fusobacterium polymorphum]|uniref:toxin-antitoxin system YwqK family antitoxin n=1 Tax=Fusobacterium nucleatum subsp. polymorphum TaxID=76857 RepID=UPI00300A7C70
MRKKFLFIFLVFLVNSIFSYSSSKTSTDEELQKVFDKNKEIIVVYRNSIKDNISKKYIENIIPTEEFNISNDNHIKITIKYTQKNKLDILAEIYTPNGDLAVKTEIKLRKEILFNEIEKLVQEIEDNEGSNQSDILNNKFSDKFLENIKSFVSYSYYDDGSVNSKTEYDFDRKSISMFTYGDGKILSKTIAKYKGSIQDENMDIDFYENLTKTFIKMKVKKIENGQEIRTFYPSGKLKSIGVYKNNILNGNYKEYNEDGSLKKETFYKDGIEINKIKFLK